MLEPLGVSSALRDPRHAAVASALPRDDAYLIIALGGVAEDALRLLLERFRTVQSLSPLADRVSALSFDVERGHYRSVPHGWEAATVIGPEQAAERLWQAAAGAAVPGDLVLVLLGTALDKKLDKKSDETAADALTRFRGEVLDQRRSLSSIVGRARCIAVLAINTSDARVLEPESAPSDGHTSDWGEHRTALVVLDLSSAVGIMPRDLVPHATAEFLELLVDVGVKQVLGVSWRPPSDMDGAILVSLDAIEAPSAAEARYLEARLRRHWAEQLLWGPSAIRQASTPLPEEGDGVRQILAAARSDTARLARRASSIVADQRKRLARFVDPMVLRPLASDVQTTVVDAANVRLGPVREELFQALAACERDNPALDKIQQITWRKLLAFVHRRFTERGRLPIDDSGWDCLAAGAEVGQIARRVARRLLGHPESGLLRAERTLATAVDDMDEAARSLDAREEPDLRLDPQRVVGRAPQPIGAPARGLLGWSAFLSLALYTLLVSAGARAELELLLAASGWIVGSILLWQAIVVGTFWLRHELACRRPAGGLRNVLELWRRWFEEVELPRRLVAEARHELDRVVELRERLERLQLHFAGEEQAWLREFTGPWFPTRAARSGPELEALGAQVEQRFGLDWLLATLQGTDGREPERRGQVIAEILEGSFIGPEGARHTTQPRATAFAAAAGAVSSAIEEEGGGSLDRRILHPARTFLRMYERALPTGDFVIHERFYASDRSLLANIAAQAGCQVHARLDSSRAALVVVSTKAVAPW